MPDYDNLGRRQKTASFASTGFLPKGMATFDTDVSQMSRSEIRDLFGLAKTAEDEDCDTDYDSDCKPTGFSISRTTVRFGLGNSAETNDNDKCDNKECNKHETLQDALRAGMPFMPDEMANSLESEIFPQLLQAKESAMTEANAEADDAFVSLRTAVDDFGKRLNSHHLEPSFKRAGLASVHAYYPDVAGLMKGCLSEVNAYFVKNATYSPTDITIRHPWVEEARVLNDGLQRVADLTVIANRKSAEYQAMKHLYDHRDKIKKSASWGAFLGGNMISAPALAGAQKLILGSDQSKQKSAISRDVLSELDDPMHDLNLRDIATMGMLSDFASNDEILSAFGQKNLLRDYTALLHTAPKTMRDKAQARALLQQYMTQGRMAPTELTSALQMNKLIPQDRLTDRRGDDNDE
jgi:hypothetical protein